MSATVSGSGDPASGTSTTAPETLEPTSTTTGATTSPSTTSTGEPISTSTSTSDITTADSSSDSTSTGSDTTGGAADCPPEKTFIVPENDNLWLYEPAHVQALAGIECIDGSLAIFPTAGSLAGLQSLRIITQALYISDYGWFNDLSGLENLEIIGHYLQVNNTDLTDLSGLDGLKQVGSVFLLVNPELTSVDGLGSLTHIMGVLHIGSISWEGHNPKLASLSGLSSLVEIGLDMEVAGTSLTTLGELASLTSVKGDLIIHFNAKLPTCDAIKFSQAVTVEGQVEIHSNLADMCS